VSSTPSELPQVTRVYQNHHLDSTRWDVYQPRADDIIVTTSYKSGTTWTQEILLHLLHGREDPLPDMHALSPWVGARFQGTTKEDIGKRLESIPGRRFVKSHLPLDGLPYYPEVKYLIVARDTRDVFMSLFNHYSSYTDTVMALMNTPDIVGDPLEPCPEDPRELWQSWITKGWFDWESEGYPMWSNLHHTQTYWDYRHLDNFLFLHYGEMLADLEGNVRKIARFCDIEVDDDDVARTVEANTFANVRKRVEQVPEDADPLALAFKGGLKRFFFKGTNGRWRDVLTDEDLALYEAAKQRVLTPDCARWLEEGGEIPR
jgi:aryl sulfotransferase